MRLWPYASESRLPEDFLIWRYHMHLYIVRHGLCRHNLPDSTFAVNDSIYNTVRQYDDVILIPQGVLQAELTGRRLKNISFDAAYASTTVRTIMTAAGILKFQQRPVELHLWDELIEIGTPRTPAPLQILCSIWDRLVPDDSTIVAVNEGDDELWRRALHVREKLFETYGGDENVLIVSHGGFMHKYLLPAILDIPREKYRLAAENCGITKLHIHTDGSVTVNCINETGHLGDSISREPFTLDIR